ncbi:kinesin-like protein KIN-10C isoform X1 [Arabidopsis lyrata subsp. lyrata]|uniref:kinesin-like protein KIN-10C isoform X1 n=2 Tax=Arabidopsis lyrata subsp. lyrata TaxID=81972 RepID=UPI000A29DDA0|nr:kinesin-like protein KIN-10C isoform X1 [Arabidopsis lyrata subsp. lyrata]|eukprot:XP_020876976.1 kinesin-like protein KIN-10C isoform X1 [Arabidopsis lyrata subsp. lyrata]
MKLLIIDTCRLCVILIHQLVFQFQPTRGTTLLKFSDTHRCLRGALQPRCMKKIQGNDRELGLTVLTMSEMLSMAVSVSVSIYEVSQETVYDLLDQEKRVVAVLEGAQGKIQLKGLPQIPVKSLSEFHKGVMIHVTTGNANPGSLGRMNFLDMAGYKDSDRSS